MLENSSFSALSLWTVVRIYKVVINNLKHKTSRLILNKSSSNIGFVLLRWVSLDVSDLSIGCLFSGHSCFFPLCLMQCCSESRKPFFCPLGLSLFHFNSPSGRGWAFHVHIHFIITEWWGKLFDVYTLGKS